MISSDDIKLLASAGEGYNAEFKKSVPAKVKDISEEVCAFANAAGGTLLIGVDDQNRIAGVKIDNDKRSAIHNSLSEITPHLPCSLDFVEVDGKTIAVIEVPSGPKKPYVLSGAIFVRIGPNTQKLTTAEQMRDFFQQAGKIYFDEGPCRGFHANTMLDASFLPVFKAESGISAGVSDEQLFQNLRVYTEDHHFKNGAVLFFGKQPEEILDKAITRCIAFQGTDKRFIIDDKVFGGNLWQQYRQAMHWLRGKLNVGYDIEGQGGGPRKELWEIPETVFKEAIINALSHRDYYEKGAVIHIELFEDRVEISNPGGLVSAISEEDFGKKSHSRNPLIFGLFARMHMVEQVGSGISRIQELMERAGLPKAGFRKEGMFTVILKRPAESAAPDNEKSRVKGRVKSRVKSRVKILELVKERPTISIPILAEEIGVSIKAIEKQIRLLKEKGILIRQGPDRGGRWQTLPNTQE